MINRDEPQQDPPAAEITYMTRFVASADAKSMASVKSSADLSQMNGEEQRRVGRASFKTHRSKRSKPPAKYAQEENDAEVQRQQLITSVKYAGLNPGTSARSDDAPYVG
jgi:hypothetical protein